MRAPDLRVYAILDPEHCGGRDPLALLRQAAAGGVTLVQLRAKRLGTAEMVMLAKGAIEVLDAFDIPLIVNDRVDVAMAAGAAGVHLGRTDMTAADARRLLGEAATIGVTVHHAHEAQAVDQAIADYAGIGPIYVTSSKDPGDPPIGPSGLRTLQQQLGSFPVCGIAGIDFENAGAVIDAGADGIAVISAIFGAVDPEAAARRLRRIVDVALAADSGAA